jgi:diguanylate cyclase (GGDEF)-like protein
MPIHTPTLLLSLAVEYIVLALVTLPSMRMWPASSGMTRWSVGIAAMAASMGLLSQRGVADGLLTVVLANAFMIFGVESVHVAARQLYQAPPMARWKHWPPYICWALLSVIWLVDSSPQELALAPWRVVAFSAALAWSASGTMYELVRRAPRPWSPGTWYVAVAMAMPVVAQVVRQVRASHAHGTQDPILSENGVLPLYAVFSACGVFMTYGFFLLQNQQLQAQLEQANARLREDAFTDPLTRVANRRRLETVAETEIRRSHRYGWSLAVMMLDIDHFKRINDVFGHAVGDEVLCLVAESCERHLRAHDLVARMGGEEFALLLPHSDLDGAESSARRLIQEIRELRIDALDGGHVTVSIGIAMLRADEIAISPLLKRSDAALYRAKTTGRDRVVVEEPEATEPAAAG